MLVLLAVALATPAIMRSHDDLTVVAVVDISGSVRRFAEPDSIGPDDGGIDRRPVFGDAAAGSDPNVDQFRGSASSLTLSRIRDWLELAAAGKRRTDRLGVVVFDGSARATLAPLSGDLPPLTLDVRGADGSSIEEAVRLGLALMPADTTHRIVLISDGNQTRGDATAAAELAAGGRANRARTARTVDAATDTNADEGRNGPDQTSPVAARRAAGPDPVPIDVLPIEYRIDSDVRIVELATPTTAQPGQVVDARVVIESTRRISGRLSARVEGAPVDINGAEPGTDRALRVPAGRTVLVVPIRLGTTPVNRVQIGFDPDDPRADALNDNNVARSITATPGAGRTLVATTRGRDVPISSLIRANDLPVEVIEPWQLPTNLLDLQNHDLIVLDDVPAGSVSTEAQAAIARHVQDLGGGLLVIGGSQSFGAGGWAGTPIASILPLDPDPPKDMVLPTAALVLVLDESGSMARPVAGARATQQELANEAAARAVESLRSETLVGVIAFSSAPQTVVRLQRLERDGQIADDIRGIVPSGGTNIGAALQAADDMLRDVDVDRKFVVLLTDGRSSSGDISQLAQSMGNRNIQVTTIGIGDEIDAELLTAIADASGGEFIRVVNATTLPRVLVDSVQIINRPLIKESTFRPQRLATGSSVAADLERVPTLNGLVVTGPRPEPDAIIEAIHPDGEPLLARWSVGLGRVTAFTSDFGGDWSTSWVDDRVARGFWMRQVRETIRPRSDGRTDLVLTIDDGRLRISTEVNDTDGPVDFLDVEATVFGPSGSETISLRQSGPGRYAADVPAEPSGEYVVAISARRGDVTMPPAVGGVSRRSGEEFRRLRSDLDLLDRIVDQTGGRRLDPLDPSAVDLFDRTGLPESVSLRPAWTVVLFILLAAYLLDVATRRIAWSGSAVREAISMRLHMLRPHAATASASVAGLRDRSTDQRDRQDEQDATRIARVDALQKATAAETQRRRIQRSIPRRSNPTASTDATDAAKANNADTADASRRSAPPSTGTTPAPDPRARTKQARSTPPAGRTTTPPSRPDSTGSTTPPTPPATETRDANTAGGRRPARRGGPAPINDRTGDASTTDPKNASGNSDASNPDDDASTTGGLLEAKRRARRRLDGDG
ncbi:MAG: VWA domain-containing protein [Phycisphaerales bacterium]